VETDWRKAGRSKRCVVYPKPPSQYQQSQRASRLWHAPGCPALLLDPPSVKKKKKVYIKLAEAVSMRCEEKLRGRSEYPITNTDMVHPP
jgi:hypothetical protein